MSEYTIAEAYTLDDGSTTYVIEYEREGFGTQRPTFTYLPGMALADAITDMKVQIEAERALNETPTPAPVTPVDTAAVGVTF